MVAVSLKKIFFKQKTAYEIDHCDWSSDVCSSDLEWGAIAFSKSLTTVSQSMGETPELRKAANRPGRASGNNIISCEKAGLFLSSFLSLDSFKEIVFVQC